VILYNSNLAKILKVDGITLFPFIFIANSKENALEWRISHEKVHLWQQLKWLIIPFYVVYLLEYVSGRFKGLNHYQAYRNISFEKEAWNKFNGG
jgi:hypothetical protein